MLTLEKFKLIAKTCKQPETYVPILQEALPKHGIVTREQIAAFIAQTCHESSDYNVLAENLNYSGERLNIVFPKYFKNRDISKYHRNPAAIANVVYANRMGNGDEQSGDGYKYRGRGILQVTGKSNYMHCSDALFGNDETLLDEPDLLMLPEHAVESALWFWNSNKLETVNDFVLLTKKINGGTHGLAARQEVYNRVLYVL